MKTRRILIIGILGWFILLPLCGAKPGIVFLSPLVDDVWSGGQLIRLQLIDLYLANVGIVEVYLDGKLIKEFNRPPWEMRYMFGVTGENHTLKAIVRGLRGEILASAQVKSYQVDDTQNVEVRQIIIPVVVKDKKGNYIRGLNKKDFQVFSDGRPIQIQYLSTSGAERFTMVQVIDISYSMRYKIHDVLQAARDFVGHLLAEGDRCSVVFFNHRVWEHSGFTGDIPGLDHRLNLFTPVDGETALHDAVVYSLKLLNKIPGWKMVVIFSDGEDNRSYTNRYSLLRKVSQTPAVIYAIDNQLDRADDILQDICSLTGGAVYPLADVKKTARVYDKIREEIKAQYVLYFSPPDKGGASRFHRLTVKVKNKEWRVRTVRGYY